MRTLYLIPIAALLFSNISIGDDGYAEIGLGGIEFKKTDAISMEREDLYLSVDKVRVKFEFKNLTNKDVIATIAFPIPRYSSELLGCEYGEGTECAKAERLSRMAKSFSVYVDGKKVESKTELKAFLKDKEVTAILDRLHLPIDSPSEIMAKIKNLDKKSIDELIGLGMITSDRVDESEWVQTKEEQPNGSHWKQIQIKKDATNYDPRWEIQRRYYWEQKFPAKKTVTIEHEYKPTTGAIQGSEEGFGNHEDYCVDTATLKSIKKICAENLKKFPGSACNGASSLEYIVTSANTWAGPIKDFYLTIEKPKPESLISLCFDKIKKTGPKTFESHLKDFAPIQEIKVLFISGTRKN